VTARKPESGDGLPKRRRGESLHAARKSRRPAADERPATTGPQATPAAEADDRWAGRPLPRRARRDAISGVLPGPAEPRIRAAELAPEAAERLIRALEPTPADRAASAPSSSPEDTGWFTPPERSDPPEPPKPEEAAPRVAPRPAGKPSGGASDTPSGGASDTPSRGASDRPSGGASDRPSRRAAKPAVPLWRRAITLVVNTVLGLALLAAAVSVQSLVLEQDQLDAPITANGGPGDAVRTALFEARLDGVEVAAALQPAGGERVEPVSGQVFVVVKMSATASTRALRLRTAWLRTSDGLRFAATERLASPALLSEKWVQPMWWSSGLYVFEVPPSALPGARVVVSEEPSILFGDQYLPEASIDMGLDAAKARAVRDVYEVPRA